MSYPMRPLNALHSVGATRIAPLPNIGLNDIEEIFHGIFKLLTLFFASSRLCGSKLYFCQGNSHTHA